jgi:hypothetical protein
MIISAKKKLHLYYWIGPIIVGGISVFMYFSGIPWMQSFVAPEINREFGALENLQLLIILAIVVVAIQGVLQKKLKLERIAFAVVAFASLIFLLEEMDYGLHYVEYFSGEKYVGGARNIHNYILNPYGLDFDAVISPVVYFILGLGFCILPLMARKTTDPWFRYLTPEPHSIGTIISMVAVAQVAFFLDKIDMHNNHALRGNISEFGEVFVHYIFFMFMFELVYKRKTPDLLSG